MPTYLYLCEKHGEFENVHSITELLTECPKCKEENVKSDPPKRLIAGGTSFQLSGGGWASSGYSSTNK
jgi:putative FmdB family regulatory protein